ncbi:MAG TPA: DUF1080 domain-containing protein [Phycisphaerae bacterium]|nr:DUF1080 domain-containing protein [Phycisphaerae bacterium]HRR86120.1 DUF1080 domain-containing protein [Phycisphaerae bacterium]
MPPLPDRAARTADIIEPPKPKEDKPKADGGGFVPLFDGKTLNGWTIYTHEGKKVEPKDSSWSVPEDGVLHTTGDESKDYWISTDEKYGDCVLRMDFKVSQGANSGIFLKVPGHDRPAYTGFEVQIIDDVGRPADKHSTGSIYDLFAPVANVSRPLGQWNSIEITCKGSLVTVVMNGLKIIDCDFSLMTEPMGKFDFPYAKMPAIGYIGMQTHGNAVSFRNIRIKKLN